MPDRSQEELLRLLNRTNNIGERLLERMDNLEKTVDGLAGDVGLLLGRSDNNKKKIASLADWIQRKLVIVMTRRISHLEERLQKLENFASHYLRLTNQKEYDTDKLQTRATFYGQMAESFSMAEIKEICFTLGVRYDDLPASTVRGKARELYLEMERVARIHKLVQQCQERRPLVNWTIT